MRELNDILHNLRAGANTEIEQDITIAKQAIKDLMLELIGEDEGDPGIDRIYERNSVRRVIRKKLEEL